MEKILSEIAKSEFGSFKKIDQKLANFNRSRLFITKYELEILYKNRPIKILNEMGNHNLGSFEVAFPSNLTIPDFRIVTKSHLWKLFHPKSNILVVDYKNISFQTFLQKTSITSNLETVCRANLFEPVINVKRTKNEEIKIITDYHLEFNDKKTAMLSLVNFYKSIIDFL